MKLINTTYLLLATFCWGVSIPLTTKLLESVATLPLLLMQLLSSALFLLVLLLFTRPSFTGLSGKMFCLIGLIGLLEPGFAYLLGFLGMETTESTISSMIISLEPVFIILLNFIIFSVAVSKSTCLFVGLAFVGAIIVLASNAGDTLDTVITKGELYVLAGVAAASLYVVVSMKLTVKIDVIIYLLIGECFTIVLLVLPAYLLLASDVILLDLPFEILISSAIVGIMQFGMAFWLFFLATKDNETGSALLLNMIPVFGVAGSMVIFTHRPNLLFYVGAIIIIASLILVEKQNRLAAKPEAEAGAGMME